MTKQELANEIAVELLNNDCLNVADFNGNTRAVMELAQELIMERIKDYNIFIGNVF